MSSTERKNNIPTVFISSTVEDLKAYRTAAAYEADRAGFKVLMKEYWVASGGKPPLRKCLEEVSKANVLAVIVAHRYGWVPQDQPGAGAESITWLECRRAVDDGNEVLAFLVEKDSGDFKWPLEWRESYRAMAATEEEEATPELQAEVQRNVKKLREFKQWLSGLGIRATFTNSDSLRAEVAAALRDWLTRNPEFAEALEPRGRDDPRVYLRALREQTAWIDIRGLHVGTQKVHRFPIEELYIPLTTSGGFLEAGAISGAGKRAAREKGLETAGREPMELEDALASRRLVIVGDPGAGKTTFLGRIAFTLSGAWLKEESPSTPPGDHAIPGQESQGGSSFPGRLESAFRRTFLGEAVEGKPRQPKGAAAQLEPPFPVSIRVADLADHIRKCRERPGYAGPAAAEAPAWLVDFLKAQNEDFNWGLDEAFFRQKLESGEALLLLDGLDEAPGRMARERVARLFENATQAYSRCRFVVTTRPLAYIGAATLAGFQVAQIEPLTQGAVQKFLEKWCHELYPESAGEAKRHLAELSEALAGRPDIRRMASNPVMLTALAVVHWNERRLPEQRADLYQSILTWLARTRERRPGREPAERCLALLEHLAMGMQNAPGGRAVQVSTARAAEILAPQFTTAAQGERLGRARDFIAQEEVDSGIIVSRGSDVRFWRLTFQEYLAAKAIGGLGECDQHKLLLSENRIYRPEWREVASLLAGVLREQGAPKVDGLISEMLNRLGDRASLAERAKCVGLAGAMVRDLSPLAYQPGDPRYQTMVQSVLGIFDAEKAGSIEFNVRLEAAEALGQAGDPRLPRDNWITIEAGTFWMGAQKADPSQPGYDPEAYADESPVHEVYLDAYQIGRYPVTVQEYQRFMDDEGYESERWWKAGGFGHAKEPEGWDEQVQRPNRPVVGVSWFDAVAYCAWLAARAPGVRLPTEAEWECAARGVGARKYPWGNEEPDARRANYVAEVGHATPVGLYPRGATPEGVDDLAGNVWELLADWFGEDYYQKSPSRNPKGPASGDSRVLRGGSWFDDPRDVRVSYRGWYAGDGDNNIGFRCVREVVP
jgi:formylglycine-generating enzyme required for sulfatase activity